MMLIYLWCIIFCIHIFLMIALTCRATLAQIVWAAWLMRSKKSPKESQRFGSKSHTTQETGHRHIYIYIYNVSNPQPTAHSPQPTPQPTTHGPQPTAKAAAT